MMLIHDQSASLGTFKYRGSNVKQLLQAHLLVLVQTCSPGRKDSAASVGLWNSGTEGNNSSGFKYG